MNMRHEIKINISMSDHIVLSSRLKALFDTDSNTDAHGAYRVRSLYFDNIYDKVLLEKINGNRYKEKFRIRFYNNNYDFIRLEKKIKIDSLCNKSKAVITRKQAEQIISGQETETTDLLIKELYSKMQLHQLRPKTIVDYKREAFVYPPGNVRITLDTDLKTGLGSRDFFNRDLPMVPSSEQYGILEIKYDEFLPDIVRYAVALTDRRQTENSKYAICRRFD